MNQLLELVEKQEAGLAFLPIYTENQQLADFLEVIAYSYIDEGGVFYIW